MHTGDRTGDRTCTQETGRARRRQDVHTGDRTFTQETGRARRRQLVASYIVLSVSLCQSMKVVTSCVVLLVLPCQSMKLVTSCVVSVTLSVHEGSHFMCCRCHFLSS